MPIFPSIGLAELVILTMVAGLACSVPLIGALVVALLVLHRRKAPPVEQD